jgi:hypothetical protein
MVSTYPLSCEFFVSSFRKPDQVLVEKCSLTGKTCFCEGVTYLTCTRRTWALAYDKRHSTPVDPIVKLVLIDPETKLPST